MGFLEKIFKKPEIEQKKFSGYNSRNYLLAPKYSTNEYLTSYSENAWLYACSNKIASAVAETPIIATKTLRNGNTKTIQDAKILELLKHPNPFQSQYEFLEISDLLLSLTGKCFWYVSKNNAGEPIELWVINPLYMSIIPDPDEYIKGYIYSATGERITLNTDEVIYINIPDPSDAYDGVGPAQAAGFAIEIDKYSSKWNRNFFFNSATPETVILADQMDDETYARAKASWNDTYGGVDNARKTAILEQVRDIKVLTQSARDMDFINLKNTTRDEILAIFGVPKVLLGMTENVNRATAETAKSIFQDNVIRPRLKRMEDKINNELVPMFGENIEVKFQSKEILNTEFLINAINQGVAAGYISAEEARERIYKIIGIE